MVHYGRYACMMISTRCYVSSRDAWPAHQGLMVETRAVEDQSLQQAQFSHDVLPPCKFCFVLAGNKLLRQTSDTHFCLTFILTTKHPPRQSKAANLCGHKSPSAMAARSSCPEAVSLSPDRISTTRPCSSATPALH